MIVKPDLYPGKWFEIIHIALSWSSVFLELVNDGYSHRSLPKVDPFAVFEKVGVIVDGY